MPESYHDRKPVICNYDRNTAFLGIIPNVPLASLSIIDYFPAVMVEIHFLYSFFHYIVANVGHLMVSCLTDEKVTSAVNEAVKLGIGHDVAREDNPLPLCLNEEGIGMPAVCSVLLKMTVVDRTHPDSFILKQHAVGDLAANEVKAKCVFGSTEQTKSDGIDWEEVERMAYIITGNEDRIDEPAFRSGSSKVVPSGRITIVDDHANGARPFGVAGVRVSCNSFVKFDHSYTDRDGYYRMNKSFSSKLRYRLVFKNVKGFAIGVNLILVPASVSTMGKAGPAGVNMTVTGKSDEKLFRRCVVNNAVYDYYSRCSEDDMNISLPPSDLRIWMFSSMKSSSAVMLHHGAILSNSQISAFLGKFSVLVKFLLPDITLGLADKEDYRSIYSTTCHELAHASHFTKVGTGYWNVYIRYIVESFIKSGGSLYGDGTGTGAGHCEVGEDWAYYLESKMFKDRYGGIFPTFGTSQWFNPQIFRYLNERGFSVSQLFSVLNKDVTSKNTLKGVLIASYPTRKNIIEQVFNRY